MHSERGKIILIAALLVVAAGVYWFFGRRSAPLSDSIRAVCVVTGEQFSLARDKLPGSLPFKNPKTGQLTLIPIFERDGKLYITQRNAVLIRPRGQLAEVNRYVDRETLEVLHEPQK